MMNQNKFGEIVFNDIDINDTLLSGVSIDDLVNIRIDQSIDLKKLQVLFPDTSSITTWKSPQTDNISVQEFDRQNQSQWFMPEKYQNLDLPQHILGLCSNDAELQRVGEELLLFQERDMFDILKFMVYLVDHMRENNIVWGIGRGSSVASFVLYLIGVHRINSIYYDLDVQEFLR